MSDERDESASELDIPNAGDERSQRRVRDRVRRQEQEAAEFYRALFRNRIARREMWRLLEMGHAFEERFAADQDRDKSMILAGEQRLAFRIYLMWQRIDMEGVLLMQRENHHALMAATQ